MRGIRPATTSRRGRRTFRAGFIAISVLAMSVLGVGVAFAVAPTVNCNGVFEGATPSDPIGKTADKTSAVPGETVTYTIRWHRNGDATADVTDCFRVDDGSNAVLNALVEVSNVANEVANAGATGSVQTLVVAVAIPNNPLLIGHTVVDRAKITSGATESRSGLLSVAVVAPPEPNQPPSVSCPDMDVDGLTASYTANASDSDGSITNYHWVFGDGETADTSDPTTSHTYASGGTYGVSVTVTDDEGDTATAEGCEVTVTEPEVVNQAPTVSCPTMTAEGLDASFSVVASDPDGTIVNYHWEFGDGSEADTTDASVTHAYAADGTYGATVTVTDDGDLTASAGPCPLTVAAGSTPPPPPPPGGNTPPQGTVVLGEKKELPKTGAAVTSIALLGAMMLMAGTVLRYGKPRSARDVFAGRGSVARMVEEYGLWLRVNAKAIRA